MDISDLFPPPPPAVSTGRAAEGGVDVGKERFANSPRVANGNLSPGQSVGIIKEGRIPVVLFSGGFHTP